MRVDSMGEPLEWVQSLKLSTGLATKKKHAPINSNRLKNFKSHRCGEKVIDFRESYVNIASF